MTTMNQGQHRMAHDVLGAEFDRTAQVWHEANIRGTQLALRSLAHGIRSIDVRSQTMTLEFSDQGDWFTLVTFTRADGKPADLDAPWQDAGLLDRLQEIASNVSTEHPSLWVPFVVDHDKGSTVHRFDLDAIIRCGGEAEHRIGERQGVTPTPTGPLQLPAGQLFAWFGRSPDGTENLLFVRVQGPKDPEPLMRPLMAQDRGLAEGFTEYATQAAIELGLGAILREFSCYQIITTIEPVL